MSRNGLPQGGEAPPADTIGLSDRSVCPRCTLALEPTDVRCPRCATDLATGAQLVVDGRYAVEAEIGRGGMGVVYLARDVGLGRRVALKVISPQYSREPRLIERFRREASALASVRDDHIVQIYAFGKHEGSFFFAMEFIAGKALDEIITGYTVNSAPVPVQLGLSILARVARGLSAIHDAGLVHRDVKPGNIMIEDRSGRPVLLDLGLVKAVTKGNVRQTDAVGSPPYMAPEQFMPTQEGVTARTDIYALGCTAYELLTGRLPYDGDAGYEILQQHARAERPAVSLRRPDLAPLDAVLRRAMAKDPNDRYPTAREFAVALDEVAAAWRGGSPTMLPPESDPKLRVNRIRILIIDDSEAFRTALARAAKRAFPDRTLEILHAGSGTEGLARAFAHPPDIVLLDYEMPGLNGADTLAALRSHGPTATTHAIVISGHAEQEVRWRFELLGVTEFLAKPAELGEILTVLRRVAAPPGEDGSHE